MDKIVVLDFGGQYCHLISRRVRELGVYSEVLPSGIRKEDLKRIENLRGIILSGGAASVYDKGSPTCDKDILALGIPVLGICYGHQLIAYLDGGRVIYGESGEYGLTKLKTNKDSRILMGVGKVSRAWMNHRDIVQNLPDGYDAVASTETSPIAAFENIDRDIYGVQFHPEVTHTERGNRILKNFVFEICKAKSEWAMSNFIENSVMEARQIIGKRKAIIGLSGGVDSSTAAILVSRAIRENMTAVYVDTGMMRHKETEFIEQTFSRFNLNLRIIRAQDRFFRELKGITEPEEKRKIIGKLFVDIFNEVAQKERAEVLVQGTIYSDRIESGITQHSSRIKSHHNVGGLPDDMVLEVYEPLRELYKDEVRRVAKGLGLPDEIIKRHVFPGPGLAVRILGEVTKEKTEIVRKASHIVEEELKKADLYDRVWMAFAVLLPVKSIGIQGDARTCKYPVAIRIIESMDAMTANFSKIPYEILEGISTRITNDIKEVNRVVYDITNKPPATMEWE